MIKPTQSGVAILFAVLLVSIVLTVGLALLNITLRQLVLSSLARESQFAFYASDSARGCARHYDSLREQSPFGYFGINSSGDLQFFLPTGEPVLNCGDEWVAVSMSPVSPPSVFSFGARFNDNISDRQTCAAVTVTKYQDPLGKTKIVVRGYNNVDPNWAPGGAGPCYQNTERTVERAATMLY